MTPYLHRPKPRPTLDEQINMLTKELMEIAAVNKKYHNDPIYRCVFDLREGMIAARKINEERGEI
jgi:hypothetical protein